MKIWIFATLGSIVVVLWHKKFVIAARALQVNIMAETVSDYAASSPIISWRVE